MQFAEFSKHLLELEKTASRLEMTRILAELFKKLKGEEIEEVSYLLEGQLVPQYLSLEFQLSIKMVLRALVRIEGSASGKGEATNLFGEADSSELEGALQKRYKKLGDVGLLAAEVLDDSTAERLTISQVYKELVAIAQENGEGSQERKLASLVELFQKLDAASAKFVSRIIVGRLRLGFSTMTMLDALSWAQTGSKEETALLEEAFQRKADLGKLARTYLETSSTEQRAKVLESYQTEEGVPIVPQLCQRLNSPQEVIEKMGEVIVEPKYDGLRVQIHIDASTKSGDPEIRAFTRNLENVSQMFPELQHLPKLLTKAKSVILDAEAIGYDPATGKLALFQTTMTRKRKHEIEATATSIPLKFFVFDVIAIDGQSLIDKTLRERKDLLSKLFKQNETFLPTEFIVTKDPNELQTYHEEQLAEGLEGVVIKQVIAPYQSGRKNWYWVKMKEKAGTQGKLTDTLDTVVMGYYFGRGKRTAFGIGAFLVGVLDAQNTLKTIAKIGTGLSDEQFKELKERADKLVIQEKPAEYEVAKALIPDVWITPNIVTEVAADELTISPNHSAGYALRFPRLIRFRTDKSWENATTMTEVEQMLAAS
ncbi:MAG: ligase 1 [Patescibacteria group bacterium]|nr:ligase 1 [Patescibacteria group bacterium]